jgi:Zn-dependent peptidase ImmA (M78 family)
MKRIFVALALAGAFLMPTAPAVAVERSPFDGAILRLVAERLGVKFNFDGQHCLDDPILMGFFAPSEGTVTICFNNANREGVDSLLVLRHELVHVAQLCHGGPLLSEDRSSSYNLADNYPLALHRTEAEARDLAAVLSEIDVSRILVKACLKPL